MAVFTNKSRDEIDFTDSTAPVINDYPRPYIDQKTTTLDGAIRKIVEEFYKKDIVSGITEFPAQILRVEQRRDRFEPSYLDNLGRDINRELSRRYKVKVVLVDDLKETPKTFDETPEDRQLIDTYPDFIYIPYSFGNNEPMNVGDFVMITYGNLLSRQDGRIIYKISGASHVQGSVGRPTKQDAPKKDKQEAKRVFKEQPPAKSSAPPVPVEAPPEVKTEPPPPPPPPPPAQPTDDLKRTLIDTGFINDKQKVRESRAKENADIEKYNADVFPSVLEAYKKEIEEIKKFNSTRPKKDHKKLPKEPEKKKIKAELGNTFEEFREKWYKQFKRGTINLYKYNKDRTTRSYPEKQELLFDFKDPKNKRYKRAVYPRDEDGYKDSLYIRAFLDVIALHETDVNFGWDLLFIGKNSAHPEDIKINKFTDYSQHPQRPSFSDNNEFYEAASSASGRYQFVWATWKNYQFTDRPNTLKTPDPLYQDFLPKTQDRAATNALFYRLRVGVATKEFSSKQKFGEILKNALEKDDIEIFIKIFALTKTEGGKDTSLGIEWTSLPKKAIEGTAGSQEKTKLQYTGANIELVPKNAKFAYLPEIFMQKLKLMVEDQQRLENGEETKYNSKQEIINLALEEYKKLLKVIEAAKASTEEPQPTAAKKSTEEKSKKGRQNPSGKPK